ncbi:hypothetical protein PsYK624_129810 [Phanerochaete sordida]|uniref:Uncharacterized protein n=1 Tax=Phanerochaete sordida TaxID=48140 RepID=A0A9P3LIW6_9APHY|nr:hypothetical protein PsYK624_129810 [Phanerochaete sordida]
MTIISTFKHIGTLSLDCDCDTGTDLSRNALAHCVDKMTITHLEISSHRTVLPVTRRLQEVVDTHALQTATVRQPLDEGTQALLRSAPALDSLSYTVFGTAPLFPSPLALRFLNLSFFMEFDALTSPTPDQPHAEWHSMLQHLRALQLPDLRELSVTILLEEGDYFPPSEVEDPPQATFADALAAHIQKNWDWVSLKVTLDRYPTLKKLKIVVLADDEWGSVTRIVPYLACAGQVVHDIAERSFGGERGRCLEVVAEHRWYGDVYHHFP